MGLIEVSESVSQIYDLPKRKMAQIVKDKVQEYQDALQAALQSLVLLQNKDDVIPVNKNSIQHVILLGDRYVPIGNGQYQIFQDYNNIGAQNGGWTIRWQGYNGNDYWTGNLKDQSQATSILDAIKTRFQEAQIHHPQYNDPTNYNAILQDRAAFKNKLDSIKDQFTETNTILIHLLAENPYAEYMGDINCQYCQTQDKKGCLYQMHDNVYQTQSQSTRLEIKAGAYEKQLINSIFKGKSKIITVLISGRPMLIDDPLSITQAFIAAWLPGTTGGEAIVKSIFGEYGFGGPDNFFNKLPSPWISTLESIKDYPKYDSDQVPKILNPKFNTGYGLSTTEIVYSVAQ
ncbi:unnamed protein product [Paramecium sonneborni]|nr:unnamed protein product [Paramecium sonneborni]